MKEYKSIKPILINLPIDLVRQLDEAANLLGMYRTDIIRKCLSRDIQYVLQVEAPKSLKIKQNLHDEYPGWVDRFNLT